jgi:prevent-host-death family protein
MQTVTIEDAARRLPELVQEAEQGEEIILTQADAPVAKIVSLSKARRPRRPGSAQGLILHIADDFDATPEGFEDYLP